MKAAAAAGLVLFFVSLVAADAQAPKGTARVRGRVVAAANSRPVRLATVSLVRLLGNKTDVTKSRTDANGEYDITGLPAGRYAFYVNHPAYLEQNFDQPRPLARYRMLEIAEGEQLSGMNFSLHRGAVITGVVTDEAGDPMPDVTVTAMREQYGPYGRTLVGVSISHIIPTDDEGRFRLFGLLPGRYVVIGTARRIDDSPNGYGRTYYPGTMDETEARVVRVDLGRDAIADFSMIPARLARISGVVRDSRGRPFTPGRIMLTPRGRDPHNFTAFPINENARFNFEAVAPGNYLVHVRPRGGEPRLVPANGEWATVPLTVTGDDISDLTVVTSSGFVVSGRVTFDGSASPASAKGMRIVTEEVDRSLQRMAYSSMAPDNGVVDSAGRFSVAGVSGRVRIIGGGSGWFIKQVRWRGQDVTFTGFDAGSDADDIEVVLTDRATTVTGSTRDARGAIVKDYIVAFFPVGQLDDADRARRVRTIRPDPDGMYRIRNLPPGEYLAAAVPVLSVPIMGEWDPEFADKVRPGAISFKLTEGQSLALSHKLTE